MPTSLQERAAGRTGGQDGRAVVWTDEAIDRLLDRSTLQAGGGEDAEGGSSSGANDILAGFRVAHFDWAAPLGTAGANGDDAAAAEAEAAEAEAEAELATAGPAAAPGFWEGLLQGRWQELQVVQHAELGACRGGGRGRGWVRAALSCRAACDRLRSLSPAAYACRQGQAEPAAAGERHGVHRRGRRSG